MVGGLRVGIPQIADDLAEKERAQRFGWRRNKDGNESRQEVAGINDILPSEENQAADNFFSQLGLQYGMVPRQRVLQIVGENRRDFGVQISDVGDEVDQFAVGYQDVRAARDRRSKELIPGGFILVPELVELLLVGSSSLSALSLCSAAGSS